MRFVTPILKGVVYPSVARARMFRPAVRPGLAVITYHGVLPDGYTPLDPGFDGSLITAAVFRRQLRFLKSKYNVISPEEMRAWAGGEADLPQRAALLTCDDGFLSNLTEMLPILDEEGLRCLFFVTGMSTGNQRAMLWYEELLLMFMRAEARNFSFSSEGLDLAGILGNREQRRALWWSAVKKLSRIDADQRERFLLQAHSYFGLESTFEFYRRTYSLADRHFSLMIGDEVRRLAAAGMTIGAHTVTHPVLSQMPPALAWREIVNSKMQLESALGKEVWAFAYPFGDPPSVTPPVLAMAQRAGFEMSFLNVGGGLGAQLSVHAMPRVHVNAEMSLSEFEAHVSGFYESLQRMFRPNTPEIEELPESSPMPRSPDLRHA